MHTAAVALGSNLGDRLGHLRAGAAGIAALPGTRIVAVSGVIETVAVVAEGDEAGPDFLNSVMIVESALGPRELLVGLLAVERAQGRDRSRERRWGARTLDLDLLFVDDAVVKDDGLVVPHPRLHERRFVLEPLARVAPGWLHPVLGLTVLELLARLEDR